MFSWLQDSGIALAIITGLLALIKSVIDNKHFAKSQQEAMDRIIESQQEDIKFSQDECALMLKTMLVLLHTANGDNVNGDLKQAIQAVEGFMIDACNSNNKN